MTTIYGLVDPRTDVVRYVGRTVNFRNRMTAHRGRSGATTPAIHAWTSELREAGLAFVAVVLEECAGDVADEREAAWIKRHRGPHLLNRASFSRLRKPIRRSPSGLDILRVSVAALCSGSTVKRYLDGDSVSESTRERIETALRKLGLAVAVRAAVAS